MQCKPHCTENLETIIGSEKYICDICDIHFGYWYRFKIFIYPTEIFEKMFMFAAQMFDTKHMKYGESRVFLQPEGERERESCGCRDSNVHRNGRKQKHQVTVSTRRGPLQSTARMTHVEMCVQLLDGWIGAWMGWDGYTMIRAATVWQYVTHTHRPSDMDPFHPSANQTAASSCLNLFDFVDGR